MIDYSDIITKFYNGKTIIFKFKYPSDRIIVSINSLIAKILSRMNRIYLLDSVLTIIRELIVNAVKANSKRVYFQNLELDINDPDEYNFGMKKFMLRVMRNLKGFKNDLINSKYEIVAAIKKTDSGIKITVKNTTAALPVEIKRIRERKEMAKQYENFSDAYAGFYDPSEGAGLGIILIVFLLRNAGVDPEHFKIIADEDSVISVFFIPDQLRKTEITGIIKEKITAQVNSLPTFPEHIIELQSLCSRKDVTIESISSKIEIDPSLTADVLKLANSALFNPGKKIHSIKEAIMRIGFKNLKSILTVSASRKIMNERYKKFEQIWDHCNKVAFYGRYIARDNKLEGIADNIFISGLLHDIGKIVLLSTDMEIVQMIAQLINNRELRTTTIIEEISIGISHTAIGAMIAERWNFPDYLIEAINYHHSPYLCKKEHEDTISVIYLANMITGIETQLYNYYFVESDILHRFGLNSEEKLGEYMKKLERIYKQDRLLLQ